MPHILVTAFNAGELSPFMDSRSDVEKYASGCRTLENMLITPYGAAVRRPGMQLAGFPKYADSKCRLIGFNFSTSTRFILEFGNKYIRVWSNGALVRDPINTNIPLEIASPYSWEHLLELQFVQVNDVMFFAHSDYPPYKLSRLANDNWTMGAIDWDYPPLVDLDLEQQEILLLSTALNTPNNYMSYADASQKFTPEDVGSEFALKFHKDPSNRYIDMNVDAEKWSTGTTPINEGEDWDFQTTGIWQATIGIFKTLPTETAKGLIQMPAVREGNTIIVTHPDHGYATHDRIQTSGGAGYAKNEAEITVISKDSYSYASTSGGPTGTVNVINLSKMELVVQYSSARDRNISSSGKATELAFYKIKIFSYGSGGGGSDKGRCIFEPRGIFEDGLVRVDGVRSDPQQQHIADVTVTMPCGIWTGHRTSISAKQSAFSPKNGYPRTVAIHGQRLCFGGTRTHPQTIWCSCVDDFLNFRLGSKESDAMQFTIAASEGNRMQWMYSQRKLMVGTAGDEWTIGGSDTSGPFSANNVQATRQSSYGSRYMRAAVINDVLLFVQRKGRKLRELVYNLDRDGWVAPDLTVLSEHITDPQLIELAFVGQPDAVVYGVRSDGVIAAMTYERDQNVVGWSRVVTSGEIESVTSIYGDGNSDDEVWFVVNRAGVRTIERFHTASKIAFEDEDIPNYRYLDCYCENPPNSFSVEDVSIVDGALEVVLSQTEFLLEPAEGDIVTFAGVGGATGLNGTYKLKATQFDSGWILTDPDTGDEIDANGWPAYTSGGAATWTGVYSVPQFQAAQEVTIYHNDGTYDTATAVNGRLPYASQPYVVGLPYASTLMPMKPVIPIEDGTSRSRNVRIHQVSASIYKTIGGQYSTDGENWFDLTNTTDDAAAVYSGEKRVCSSGDYTVSPDITLRQTAPHPFCVRSIVMSLDAYGQ